MPRWRVGPPQGESWKDWSPLRGLPTDPHSADYPTDYSTDYPTDYPYGLPLIIKQIPFYGVEKYQKHTCSTWNSRHFLFGHLDPVFFIFAPFSTGHIPKRCFHIFIFISCLNCLPSTISFTKKQLLNPSKEVEIIEIDAPESTNRWTKMLWYIYDILSSSKQLRQLKMINIQQLLPILHCGSSVLVGGRCRVGRKWKRLDRDVWKENGGCFSSDRVGGAGMLLVFFYPVKRNLVDC